MRSSSLLLWPRGGLVALAVLLAGPLAAQDNSFGGSSANARMADGFDFPVGWPNADGYHKARGFTPNGHLGDDWDGNGGGNTDLGDPVYCVGHGVVVLAGNMHMGWGNVVMIRHSFREPAEGSAVKTVDTLYGHLDTFLVKPGQLVTRGQQIGTVGTAFGLYDAHLHFEVRRNINIGMFRSMFARDLTNYYDPTAFINEHRQLQGGGGSVLIALNTFKPLNGEASSLPVADGAYELGINRSPAKVAELESSHLSKSAYAIKRRTPTGSTGSTGSTGNAAFDKINNQFRVDRYSEERQKPDGKP